MNVDRVPEPRQLWAVLRPALRFAPVRGVAVRRAVLRPAALLPRALPPCEVAPRRAVVVFRAPVALR